MSPPGYVGRYINLERSPERRRDVEALLARLGLADRYERFLGVDGRTAPPRPGIAHPGELGCYLSHLGVITEAIAGERWLHVLEDDATMSRFAAPVIQAICDSPDFARYDVVFTNTRLALDVGTAVQLRATFDANVTTAATGEVTAVHSTTLIPLAGRSFTLTTSYLLNPRSMARTAALLSHHLENEPFEPVDQVFCKLSRSGQLSMAFTAPFLTISRWGVDSTIMGPPSLWAKANRIIEAALYADRNVAEIRQFVEDLARATPASVTTDLMIAGLSYLIRS